MRCKIKHSRQSEIKVQQPLKLLNVSAQAKAHGTGKKWESYRQVWDTGSQSFRDAPKGGCIKGHIKK